ncbi:MAG TPA: hydantoinase/oxoprolinase family protein [Desulfobacteraceae bacterium]|nr:hydantoinase/oxoprolinase family protein [Deltaproteobacteria bacterium]HDM09933.1 hydantoinase/oxoprolinase family protein [Desulfobacteraceae bacterium]
MIVIGADTGGTFTDFVYKDGDSWGVYKVLSTPWNPAEAVLKGLRHIAQGRKKQVVHGSTVATNAILERKGAVTALITNRGFEDILEIGRQNRSWLYDLAYRKEPHLIPQGLRFGVKGRILNTGEELEPLDEKDVREAIRKVTDAGAESVAVCLLFSYANPAHEKRVGELLAPEHVSTSPSHEILSEFREFERFSTTAINAYVSPKMRKYIGYLIEQLDQGDILSIMQSNGGSISAETAMRESVRTILSGPAGGAVGAYEIGKAAGYEKLITFDMGGTSTDVSLVDGALSLTVESSISGYPLKVPMLDIHTVGAGGGSIAYLDEGGSLRVGPESAGADPGPICYGKGERITVTDANLYLGRLIPEYFLGGNMRLEARRLESYFQEMAGKTGLEKIELAEGILDIANTAMEKAIRVISVERGHDPREFVLFSFGGAGGMHAAFLARLLNIPKVLVPENPGILSAIGMLMADVIKDYSYTIMKNQFTTTREELSKLFQSLEDRGSQDLASEGISGEKMVMERYLDMRYEGQSYEIIVPFEGDYIEGFHSLHEKTYGYRNEDKIVEVVNVRLRARGIPEKPQFTRYEVGPEAPEPEAIVAERDVVFEGKNYKTLVYSREKLVSGNMVKGPAIIVEYSSTIVIPPFASVRVDEFRNLIIKVM